MLATQCFLLSSCKQITQPTLGNEQKGSSPVKYANNADSNSAHLAVVDPVQVAGKLINLNNWSKSDPCAGKIINETDHYWDVSFQIPEAEQRGKHPDHRIVRVFKMGNEPAELGAD